MSESAKRLLARIEALDTAAGDVRRRSESYQRMADELAATVGRAESPDGLVRAVATADGALRSITFADEVRTIPPAELSAAVVRTVAAARAAAARAQAEVVRRGLDDTELLDKVLESEQRLFGDQRPADPGPPPPATRRPETVEDETYEYDTVFNRRSTSEP